MSLVGDRQREEVHRTAAAWHARMLEPRSEAEVDAFEIWLASDPAHPRAYAEMEALSAAGRALPQQSNKNGAPKASDSRWRPAAAVALAVVAVIVGVWAWQLSSAPAFAAVTNPGPAVRTIRLADGTGIVLDADSQIAVAQGSGARSIRVDKGRVRIDARSTALPVQVAAGLSSFTATAALFDVVVDGPSVTIASLDGRVAILEDKGRDPSTVEQGRAILVDEEGRHPVAHDPAWPASRMRFERARLDRVVAIANRLGDPDIVLADPSLAAIPVSGVLDLRMTRPLARKLGAALGLRVRDEAGKLELARPRER